MLQEFDEIEDMMCSICMESMVQGEVIVKTNCGIDALFPTEMKEALLKGHKFHKDCLKQWFTKGQNNMTEKCPLCRQDIIRDTVASQAGPTSSNQHRLQQRSNSVLNSEQVSPSRGTFDIYSLGRSLVERNNPQSATSTIRSQNMAEMQMETLAQLQIY